MSKASNGANPVPSQAEPSPVPHLNSSQKSDQILKKYEPTSQLILQRELPQQPAKATGKEDDAALSSQSRSRHEVSNLRPWNFTGPEEKTTTLSVLQEDNNNRQLETEHTPRYGSGSTASEKIRLRSITHAQNQSSRLSHGDVSTWNQLKRKPKNDSARDRTGSQKDLATAKSPQGDFWANFDAAQSKKIFSQTRKNDLMWKNRGTQDINLRKPDNDWTTKIDDHSTKKIDDNWINKKNVTNNVQVMFDQSRTRKNDRQEEVFLDRPPQKYREGKVKKKDRRERERVRKKKDDAYDEKKILEQELSEEKKRKKIEKKRAEKAVAPKIQIPEYINLARLAEGLRVTPSDLLVQLVDWGFENITEDSIMTGETAGLVAQEYGFEPVIDMGSNLDLRARPPVEDSSTLPSRPPVITIMGHVDHGKTTLLDYLRKSSIAAQEHGGITQHIGAFSVRLASGMVATFLDTPGHAAFLSMRQRGANVTDIIILVVAADDSVMPQTLEALKHARSAKVPIIVAITKIDKYEANIEKVKQDLGAQEIEIEEYGGDVQVVPVSGKTGEGMTDLEENIQLLAEVLDIRGDRTGMAEGWVLESSLKHYGKTATVLVKRGILKVGSVIVAGKTLAKVRAVRNEAGKNIKEAGPGTPAEVLGWRDLPEAGDEVIQASDERAARTAIQYRESLEDRAAESAEAPKLQREREEQKRRKEAERIAIKKAAEEGMKETVDQMRRRLQQEEEDAAASGLKLVNFILRADVAGSVEAVSASIQEIGNFEIQSRILKAAVGPPTMSDIELATTTGAAIVSFNNEIPSNVMLAADKAGIKLIDHTVIYHVADDVHAYIESHLTPHILERMVGEAEVLELFKINITRRIYQTIAGSRVTNGQVTQGAKVKILRMGQEVYSGKTIPSKMV